MKKPTSIVGALAALPPFIHTQELDFKLEIYADYGPDIRVCYVLQQGDEHPLVQDGSWQNPYAQGARQSFLCLQERIETDQELLHTLLNLRAWLHQEELINPENYPAFED